MNTDTLLCTFIIYIIPSIKKYAEYTLIELEQQSHIWSQICPYRVTTEVE